MHLSQAGKKSGIGDGNIEILSSFEENMGWETRPSLSKCMGWPQYYAFPAHTFLKRTIIPYTLHAFGGGGRGIRRRDPYSIT